jgi:plastocyanin
MRHLALGSILLLASAQLARAATINVTVGGPGSLKFNPPFVKAAINDVVQFIFMQKNHTVRQSSFDNPCVGLNGGFSPDFMPVTDTQTEFPVARLDVLRETPIWAFCPQGNHCKAGMVFALNPRNASELAAFQAAAAASGSGGGGAPPPSPSPRPTSPTSIPSPVPSSTDHRIIVGGGGILAFNPPNISAIPGDTITFEFRDKNHSVLASSFDKPCLDLLSTTGQRGFDSGFRPVSDGQISRFTLPVADPNPIWAFCSQAKHCSQGMVFAVNADESSDRNFDAFLKRAKGLSSSTNINPNSNSSSSAAWRLGVGSPSKALVLGLSAAALLL